MRIFQASDQLGYPASTTRKASSKPTPGAGPQNTPRFFYLLSTNLQNLLRSVATERHFARREVLMQAGNKGSRLFVLLEGRVKVFRNNPDRKFCLSVLLPGDCFGELSIIDSLEASADIVATESGSALMISRESLYEILQQQPVFQHEFLRYLSSKMRNTIEDVCSIALDDVYGRLRRVLYRLAANDGDEQQIHNITHLEISEMIGASREMVSIIFKELRMGGYVITEGGNITIRKALPKKR